jgi:malonyl-CoA O-methyltransferase
MTDSAHKRDVARAFGRAASYDSNADVQREVAEALASRIADSPLPAHPAILEIGCGTGFLTRALAARIGAADRMVTDIAPEMVARARAGGVPGAYHVVDGERPDLAPALRDARFDLICSSLAFQWFGDPAAAIARLSSHLKPGGLLAFSTMAAGSFAEWRMAHEFEGVAAGTPPYLDASELLALAPPTMTALVELGDYRPPVAGARSFLHGLKAIGAGVPAAGHRPLAVPTLRRVMARFDASGGQATYRVAFGLFRAPPEPA